MIRQAAFPNLDDRCGRLMVVASFNEWYEDTQIEATVGKADATSRDSSESASQFTFGDCYADYGMLYRDLLRDEVSGERI